MAEGPTNGSGEQQAPQATAKVFIGDAQIAFQRRDGSGVVIDLDEVLDKAQNGGDPTPALLWVQIALMQSIVRNTAQTAELMSIASKRAQEAGTPEAISAATQAAVDLVSNVMKGQGNGAGG